MGCGWRLLHIRLNLAPELWTSTECSVWQPYTTVSEPAPSVFPLGVP